MRGIQYTAINNLSDTTSQTSSLIQGDQIVAASFQANFSEATAAGTLLIQSSNDPTNVGNLPQDAIVTNWINVPGAVATATVTAGAAVVVYIPQGYTARWYRIVFTRSAGAGTFIVNMFAQSI